MNKLKKYNLSGKKLGEITVNEALVNAETNSQLIKDYIVAIRENARQWSACTKTRSEVSHTTKKPHRQKGTGRSRQGSLVAPHFKGGGVAFGPKPKDIYTRINQKEKKAAIRSLISEKIKAENVCVLDSTQMKEPKTKSLVTFIEKGKIEGRILFLGEGEYSDNRSVKCDKHVNFIKSLRNLPKVQFKLAKNVSGYDIAVAKQLVITEEALKELEQWLA